jgi:hypothetical protein
MDRVLLRVKIKVLKWSKRGAIPQVHRAGFCLTQTKAIFVENSQLYYLQQKCAMSR